jgi:hypothetical protein
VRLAELPVRRQLQDGRALALPELRHEDNPAVGKLQCIVVRVRFAGVCSSKPRKPFAVHAKPQAGHEASEGVDGLDLALERKFGAREQTDRHARLTHRREAAGFGPRKLS